MSEASYTVTVEGLEELEARLERYPEIAKAVLVPTMTRVVTRTADNIALPVNAGGPMPVYRGRLQFAVKSSPKVESLGGEIKGAVDSGDVPYAYDMEVGPPAGQQPDILLLRRWCHLVLGDAGAAVAVAKALFEGRSRVQRRPYAMFARGWVATVEWARGEFVKARNEIVRRLAGEGES